MKEMRFPFIKYLVTPPTIKPDRYVYRPVIPIKLSLGEKAVTFNGLIDSGADECTFPAWIAKTFGHDEYKGKKRIFSGIGGSVLAYLHKTHLSVSGIEFLTDVYYSHEWYDMPYGLLGEVDFFKRFDIDFSYKEK